MILTYHSGFCIRASAGDTTLVFGPVSKQSKNFKQTNFGADVAFIPLNHPDLNGADEAARGDKQPFVVMGPGEYEVKGTTVFGFPTSSGWGGEERINTVYEVSFDGMTILYLGALHGTDLPKELLEMDAPDIMIAPICGEGALTPAEAEKLAVKLEAKVLIPVAGSDATIKVLLKEAGAEDVKPIEKFTVKPKDLSGKQNEIVVLSA